MTTHKIVLLRDKQTVFEKEYSSYAELAGDYNRLRRWYNFTTYQTYTKNISGTWISDDLI